MDPEPSDHALTAGVPGPQPSDPGRRDEVESTVIPADRVAGIGDAGVDGSDSPGPHETAVDVDEAAEPREPGAGYRAAASS